jgi:hypothetical protein
MEEVVKVHKVALDGINGCHIGFLPQQYFKKHGAHKFDHLFLFVVPDQCKSPNTLDRSQSHRNHSMVICDIIKSNPRNNGKRPLDGDPCICSSSESDDSVTSVTSEANNKKRFDSDNAARKAQKRYTRHNNAFH